MRTLLMNLTVKKPIQTATKWKIWKCSSKLRLNTRIQEAHVAKLKMGI